MKQTVEAIHRDLFMPIYEQTPKELKPSLLEIIGLKMRIGNFYQRKYITKDQYDLMVRFKNDHGLMSNNTIGEPAQYDREQLLKYNNALLNLISILAPTNKRKRLEGEQKRIELLLSI